MISAPLTLTSELEAINQMLAAIGEAEVSDVDPANLPDVANASRVLRSVLRSFLTRGWSFNTDTEYLIPRTVEGYIQVPATALYADVSRSEYRDGVRRGNRMWDRANHTFVWDRDLKLDLKWFLPFEEIPEAARTWVTIRAAREFARESLGEPLTDRFTEEAEQQAWVAFFQDEAERADHNIFDGGDMHLLLNRSVHSFRVG